MKIGPITQFLMIGGVVGAFLPFFVSLCIFGTTLQTFVAAPPPTAGYWSGGPTTVPTRVPIRAEVLTGTARSAGSGAVFVLWSRLGAFAGEAVAIRRGGKEGNATRKAWLGAIVGSAIFIGLGLCGLPH